MLEDSNALFFGVLLRLQVVQKTAASLLTDIKKSDHIPPVLASLHWLPVRYTIDS